MDLLHQKNKTLSAESNWKIDFLCYFFPFVFNSLLFTYLMATRGFPAVGGYYLIHYLYNYSHGFLARGLVGEVLSLFFENIDDNVTKWTVFFFSVCLLVSASLCMGKALSKVKNDREKLFYVIFFLLVLFISPATFRNYFIDIKLDKMLWALTLFGVFCTDRKYLIWLAPIFCILATLVNPVFLFCSMILISIILLQEFHLSDKSVKNGIICAVSYGTMIFLGLYGTISEKHVGFSTPREMVDYYFSRYTGNTTIDYYSFENEWLFDYFEPLNNIFKKSYEIYFVNWGNSTKCILTFIFFAVPTITLFICIWKTAIKCENDRFQKFIYFLCMISPVVLIPPISISWEATKYFTNNFIVQLCLLVYFVVRNNESVIVTLRKAVNFCKSHMIFTIFAVMYFMLFFI